MIRAPEREAPPQPLMLGEQNGEVHFVNDNPPIMYIKGSDDQFYVTNDRETVDRFLEFHSLDKLRSVRFCGLILGDNRTACFLKNGIGYEVGSDPLEEANYHVVPEPIYQPYQSREWETESSSEWYPQPFYTAQCPSPPTALPPPPRSLSPPRQPNTQQAKVTRFLSPEPVCIRPIPRNAPTPPIPPPVRRSESPVFTADIPSPQPSLLDVDDWADRITSSSPTWPPTDFTFSAQHKLIVQQVRRMSASSANNESYSLPLPAPNPPPQDFWEQSDHEIEAIIDELSDQQLHILLNKWYRIPKKFNRDAYPYPCEGFVVPNSDNKTILIFTRRLGCLTLPENPNRKGRLYAYFLVCGPGIYKAWEFDSSPPPSFKSTKYVNTSNVEMKGYGLMSPGRRDDSESLWYVWNDQTGLMQCLASCARELKNKYYDWTPTCQMVMFDATSEDNGRNWKVKTISFVGYPTAERLSIFPQQVYYIKNLRVLPSNQQPNPAKEVVFYSSFLNDHVHVRVAHILDKTVTITLERLYNAVVFASWGNNGQSRRFQGLVAGSEPVLNQLTRPSFAKLASLLELKYWDRESEEQQKNVVQEPEVNLLF